MEKKAIGYLRVSTPGQVDEGVSLDSQRAKIRAWCEVNDVQLAELHEDAGLSGKRADNRPALQKALESAVSTKGVLIVYSLSRLARSTKDTLQIAERIEKAGADLVSISEKIDTTSAAGKMVFRLLAVLNEFERDLISERTKAAMSHLRQQNRFLGQVPYGYAMEPDGRTMKKVASEQRAICQMRKMNANGSSLRSIASKLNETKIPTKSGRPWGHTTVASILKRIDG